MIIRDVLWNGKGERRLPKERELLAAIKQTPDLWRVCELNPWGPVYLLPTQEWVALLHKQLLKLKAKRVLEIGAGDGFLTQSLRALKPPYWLHATDSGAWVPPSARMSKEDMREFKGVSIAGLKLGPKVEQLPSVAAVSKYEPDVVLVSWPPPGPMVEHAIRMPVRYVIDISVDGDVCGNGTKTWRYNKEFLAGPIESRALCRLDQDGKGRHTRVTLYYGKAHPKFALGEATAAPRARARSRSATVAQDSRLRRKR